MTPRCNIGLLSVKFDSLKIKRLLTSLDSNDFTFFVLHKMHHMMNFSKNGNRILFLINNVWKWIKKSEFDNKWNVRFSTFMLCIQFAFSNPKWANGTVVHGGHRTGLNKKNRTKLTGHGPDRTNYVPAHPCFQSGSSRLETVSHSI